MGATLQLQYETVRRRSLRLAEPLSAEDCCAQSMPDASPIKWHLAHTTWFFETFVLEGYERRFVPFDPAYRYLFNSYYNGIGARHPRAQRGLLTRPSLEEVHAWRRQVDERIAALLVAGGHGDALQALVTLGLHHEQQHQELMLTDLKHLLSHNALCPAYRAEPLPRTAAAAPLEWLRFEGGLADIGYDGDGFCFDNEQPRHRVHLAPFELASRLVTNAEYARFVEQGGYRDPSLWLSDGWDRVASGELAHPLYWRPDGNGGWLEFTLHGLAPLDPGRAVAHVSLYEADAYARWAGARLPLEAEWEVAARGAPVESGSLHPGAAGPQNLSQLFGACWQWTASAYAPYPGFASAPGAIGEYNGKFMVNQYVLRGSSCATPAGHARASYRNFFPAGARWQFTGIRLAR
jgi:ergothioneine biosynthesis protein EgtB